MSALVTSQNVREVVRKLSLLRTGSPIATDCETTGLHPFQGDTLRGFSIAFYDVEGVPEGTVVPIVSYYVPVDYPGSFDNLSTGNLQLLCGAIASIDPLYVYHHAKFDLRFLRQLPSAPHGGVYFPVPEPYKLWDTKVVAWLMDENLSSSLGAQAAMHLGVTKSDYMRPLVIEKGKQALIAEGVKRPKIEESLSRGWALVTAEETAEYGAMDAELTLRLCERQHELLYDYRQHPTLHGHPRQAIEREMQVQGLLLRVEANGIMVDSGRLKELLEQAETECQRIEDEFLTSYGTNINSTKQLAELLFDTLEYESPSKTASGRRSVNRATLEKLPQTAITRDLLKQRRLRKAISGYLIPLLEHVCDDDRIHPTFWSTGTVTGRYSCSDPNLQTIPRRDTLVGVRGCFVADDGYELWSYDLKAAEMRVMAGLSQDETLLEGVRSGEDLHGKLAAQVFGEKYTGLQRRFAKNLAFGYFYGLTSPTTAAKYIEGPNATKTASKILDGLKTMYPGVTQYMRRTTREAEKVGFVRVNDNHWPGRYRRFVTESVRKPLPFTASNAKIQGSIGEAMKDYMLTSEPLLDAVGARICLQVHDELVIEVPPGMGYEVQKILQGVSDKLDFFDIPMEWDAQPWEAHE